MSQQNVDFEVDQYVPIMSAVIRNKTVKQYGITYLGASIFYPDESKKNKLMISFGRNITNILTKYSEIKPGDLIELRDQTYQSTVKVNEDIVVNVINFPLSKVVPAYVDITYISDPLNINSNKQSLSIKNQKQKSITEYEEKQIIDKYNAFNDHINYKQIYSNNNKKIKSNKNSKKRTFREMDNKENVIINDTIHKKRKIMDITDETNILIANENKNNQQITHTENDEKNIIANDIIEIEHYSLENENINSIEIDHSSQEKINNKNVLDIDNSNIEQQLNEKRSDKEEIDIDENSEENQQNISENKHEKELNLNDNEIEELKKKHLYMPQHIINNQDQLLQFNGNDTVIRLVYDSEDEIVLENENKEYDNIEMDPYIESLLDLVNKQAYDGDWIISKCGKYWTRKDT